MSGRRRTVACCLLVVASSACTVVDVAPGPAQTNEPTPTLSRRPPELSTAATSTVPASATPVHVLRVVDGDTVVLSGLEVGKPDTRTSGRHARLIGVDTPEVFGGVECFGRAASAFTKGHLDGHQVFVDLDVQPVDVYNRALVYIWQEDGTFFNARLVEEGYALQLTIPPNVRYAELFTRLARQARKSNSGLWSACD